MIADGTGLSVLIPFREDASGPHGAGTRDAALTFVRSRWRALGIPVLVQPDIEPGTSNPAPWRKGLAIERGARQLASARVEVVIVSDADVWCPPAAVGRALREVRDGACWAVPHLWVDRLTAATSEAYRAGAMAYSRHEIERRHRGHQGGGMLVMRTSDLVDVHPDPRFVGWGQEDDAWAYALNTMIGRPWRGTATMVHLWHPPAPRRSPVNGSLENVSLYRRYAAANGDRAAMRALMDEWRTTA